MSLDKMEAVPVDTHVWQLAVREYRWSGQSNNKSLKDAIYKEIGMRYFFFCAKLRLSVCCFACKSSCDGFCTMLMLGPSS